jgi:crotonobetaine/carnitine-CoA ligase
MPILDLERNIGALVEKAAARYGDRKVLFVDHEGMSYSFRELNEKVNQYANALREAGVQAGEHVAVMLPNCSEFPFTWLALAKLGAAMVPVNVRSGVTDLEYLLDDSDSTRLVIHSDYLSTFRKIPREKHRVKTVWRAGSDDQPDILSLGKLASQMPTKFEAANPSLDDVMNLQYTSGTTGMPKAALTTHEYWLVLAKFAAEQMTPEDVFLTMSPFYYMDPQWELLMALTCGCSVVMVDKITLENFAVCVKKYPVTGFWAFPELLYLAQFEQDKDHHLRLALLSAFPPELHRVFEERFHVIAREVYGSTEIGPGAMVAIQDTHLVGSGSVGKPLAYRELRIVDEYGNDVHPGEVGELLVKGPGIFKGYYHKPEANAKAFAGEYFCTGDLFRQDNDGNYYFAGRKKEMIRRSGDNISALEVERVLVSHPKIAEAAVVPVPDRARGEEVKAYLLLAPGESEETLPPEEVIRYCQERIAKFKVPRYLEYMAEDFPRSTSGKIQKHELLAKGDLTEGCYDRFGEQKIPAA